MKSTHTSKFTLNQIGSGRHRINIHTLPPRARIHHALACCAATMAAGETGAAQEVAEQERKSQRRKMNRALRENYNEKMKGEHHACGSKA